MRVCKQGAVTRTTTEEARSVCKFACPNIGCTKVFHNKHGMLCHKGRCKWRNEYLIDRIVDVRGPANSSSQEFLIEWKGYGREHDCWRPRRDIDPDYVTEYLKAHDMYDYNWPGKRCPCCDLPCKSAHGVKMHLRACRYVASAAQSFTGTVADKKVK